MVEKSDVVEECSSCVRLQQEIEITRKDQAATLKMIKEKIMSTDKLIKKYQKKCDDFDKQAKQLNDLTVKHQSCERNTEILQEQLSHSLEVTKPQKKTITRLIQEKFVAEETILELKRKNDELEKVVNQVKHDIQLRDEKDSSWKLEQQLQAKQIEKEKERAEKLTKELEKAKEEIKKGKVLVKEQTSECRAFESKCTNFQSQVNKLKEELKYTRNNGGLLNQAKRKPSPRELNMTRTTRQSLKMCEEKLDELLSASNQECKSPVEDERPALTSIFAQMTNIADCPLSPVSPSPTESQDWSSESSDDHSDGSGTDSEGGSLGDLGDILELSLKHKNATILKDLTGENSSIDGDAGGGLESESGDEDTENNNELVSAANDDENPEKSEQIIQEENDKETMHDSYLEKEQNTPEKGQCEEQVRKTSVSEDIDNTNCQSTSCETAVFSSDEATRSPTSKAPSQVNTRDSRAENMDTNENALQVVGSETTSIVKVSCKSFDKESIEKLDIKNNNLSSTSLNKDVKDSLFVSDGSENDDITKNCSESTTDISNHFRTETPRFEESGIIDDLCGSVGGAVHETSGEKLLLENNVKSLDLDKSEAEEEFKDGGVAKCADHPNRVLPGKSIDEGDDTQDIPVTDNTRHAENDTHLATKNNNPSKHSEYTSKSVEKEFKNENKDDSLPRNNNIKYSLENIEERLENVPSEYQKLGMVCDMDNNVDEQVGSVDKDRDYVSDEEKSSSTRHTHNVIIENSGDKIRSLKQTSKDTKCREKSLTENAKMSSFPNKDKVLEPKNEVVRNNKRTKRNNPEESDGRRKRPKRGATPEVGATPTNFNSTPTETVDDNLKCSQKEHDKNQSATETSIDEKDTLSTHILEHDSIYSNDNNTSSNRDDKSSVADDFAKKCHIDSTEFSSELLNEDENTAVEGSKVDSVDNKVVPHSSDLAKSYNKVDSDSPCYKVSSVTIMEEGMEEVLDEGGTSEVVDTNTSVLDVLHDALDHNSGERAMDLEAFTLVDVVDYDLNDQNNQVDDIHQSDFTTLDQSKARISNPSIPSLSLASVVNDSFHVFDVEMPILSPLPPSPSSSGKSSPAREEHTPSFFTSFPTLAALKPSFRSTSVGTSGVSLASFVSQASITAKRHGSPAEYKCHEPLKKSKTPRQDTTDDPGHDQVKKLKGNKQMMKKLSVRPVFFTERQYADKVLVYLTQEHADIGTVLSRLSNTKSMSSDTPIANALVEFQHNEDLMPTIIQKYHDRDRQHQEQSSRLADLNNWTPVMSVFEDRVCLVVTRLSQVEHLKGLSTKVISLLSSAIIHSCSTTEEPDKRCIASHCRLVCALFRSDSNLQRMRVLCYDIIQSLYSRPGTVLYLMISIAGVWPAVLVSSASPSTTSKGFVCLAGESYLPLPCTMQMVLTTWARTYDWVLLGNVLDWLCAWKQVPSGVLSLEQLAGELVRIMKDPLTAQLMHGKDGHPVLGFGLYEVIKALELVSCMLGWAWLNNVLVRRYIWEILTRWINQIQPETKRSDVIKPCLDRSTSVDYNKEDQQRIDAGGTRNGKDILHNDPQGGPPDQVPEPTVVAAIRLLGLVCRIAVQHYQKIPRVIPLLVGLLQTTRDWPVPYAVQLASAYSLLEVSPWQPSRVLSALDEWKSVQDSQSKSLPASLIQGFISLRICLALKKDASVLSEGCT